MSGRYPARRSNPPASAWVKAHAGSGKTHALVGRMLRLLAEGIDPGRILCLTFTRAAAAEMSKRLIDALSRWAVITAEELRAELAGAGLTEPDDGDLARARALFTAVHEAPGGMKIETIHAFCERLLRLFPVEAGISPGFTIMSEQTARAELERALRFVARRHRSGAVARALEAVARATDEENCLDLLARIHGARTALALFLGGDGASKLPPILHPLLRLPEGLTAAGVREGLAFDVGAYSRLAETLRRGPKTDRERAAHIDRLAHGGATLIELSTLFLTTEGKARTTNGLISKNLARDEPWALELLLADQERLIRGLATLADLDHVGATVELMSLAAAVVKEVADRKQRANLLDFEDLIIHVNRLLSAGPEAAWVLYKLDGGIEHLLIDEAQDTSPAQWMIVKSLTEEFFAGAGTLPPTLRTVFAVGDHKQSIFRFQGADPDNFESMRHYFAKKARDAERPFDTPLLTVSRRSTPEVLKAVDLVFARGSARENLTGADTSPIVHEAHRSRDVGTVEIWPLMAGAEEAERTSWKLPVDHVPATAPHRLLAAEIAEKVASWIGKKLLKSEGRAVEPGDILILVRQRNRLFEAMIRELRRRGVAVAGADRLKVHAHIAVLDLVAAARFCLAPEDDYALACVLKSPLIAAPLDENELQEVAAGRGPSSLWEALRNHPGAKCASAAMQIAGWIEGARGLRPFDFLSTLAGEAAPAFACRLGGEAADAIEAFLELALGYEDQATPSLAGFLLWFSGQEAEIKRDMDQSRSEVRIMTVHGAKGLESSIVILPDTTRVPDRRNEGPLLLVGSPGATTKVPLWRLPGRRLSEAFEEQLVCVDRERASEFRRLLYVAMTRARDELYVCGHGEDGKLPEDCWYRLIEETLKGAMRPVEEGILRLGADPSYLPEPPPRDDRVPAVPSWANRPPPAATVSARWRSTESAPSGPGVSAPGITTATPPCA